MKNEYKTRQKDIILRLLLENAHRHLTASEISSLLTERGERVGLTTLYRYLDKLCEKDLVQKFSIPGESAKYTFVSDEETGHFHLKCTECGRLLCAECEKLSELCRHIGSDHGFEVALGSTTFYGKCRSCKEAERNKNE